MRWWWFVYAVREASIPVYEPLGNVPNPTRRLSILSILHHKRPISRCDSLGPNSTMLPYHLHREPALQIWGWDWRMNQSRQESSSTSTFLAFMPGRQVTKPVILRLLLRDARANESPIYLVVGTSCPFRFVLRRLVQPNGPDGGAMCTHPCCTS